MNVMITLFEEWLYLADEQYNFTKGGAFRSFIILAAERYKNSHTFNSVNTRVENVGS